MSPEEIMEFNLREAGILWHYTTQQGLVGILQSGELWASHIAYLNDAREFEHALHLLSEVLELRVREGHILDTTARTVLSSFRRSQSPNAQTGPYVVSFSVKDDDLSQWRAYSGSGVGYALGFAKDRFPLTSKPVWPVRLVSCTYDETTQRACLENLCDRLIDNLPKSRSVSDLEAVNATHLAWREFMEIAPRFKVSAGGSTYFPA